MTIQEQEDGLLITHLPLEDMAMLALPLPLTSDVQRVLTALLEGRRVAAADDAFEYKNYRRTAPLGVYRKFVAMERQLHEMGLVRVKGGRSI